MSDKILLPGEVAERLGVDPKTLTRWANKGLIPSFRTLGGHRRYYESAVQKVLRGMHSK